MEPLKPIQSLPDKASNFNIKKELFKYIRVWYWFVLSVIDFIFGNYHISFLEFVIFYYNMQNVYAAKE